MSTKPAAKPGRPRTGILDVRTLADGTVAFYGRLRLADGALSHSFRLDRATREAARTALARLQVEEDATGKVHLARVERQEQLEAAKGEHVGEWFARYLPTVEGGERHRKVIGAQWNKWLLPMLGGKVMAMLTRDDVEDARDHLDAAVDAGQIVGKTALNVWSILTSALKAAVGSRDRTLRVHSAPLHFGILPPRRGLSKRRPWLYPSELARLLACEGVPVEWRQTYAIAAYTGLRPNELRVLQWADVDLEAGTVNVSKAWDAEEHRVKSTKTPAGRRVIPLEPALRPLLEQLAGDRGDRVVDLGVDADRGHGGWFRAHLLAAGVERDRLHHTNETEMAVDFRSLRDSYATWCALAGVSEKAIQRRLGHVSGETTDGYLKVAETVGGGHVGVPFAPLPAALLITPAIKRAGNASFPRAIRRPRQESDLRPSV